MNMTKILLIALTGSGLFAGSAPAQPSDAPQPTVTPADVPPSNVASDFKLVTPDMTLPAYTSKAAQPAAAPVDATPHPKHVTVPQASPRGPMSAWRRAYIAEHGHQPPTKKRH